jgi:hypothetical protein
MSGHGLSLSPKAQAEYVRDLSDTSAQPIFAQHNEVFRTAPSAMLALDGKKLDPCALAEPADPLRDHLWLAIRLAVGPVRAAWQSIELKPAGTEFDISLVLDSERFFLS